MDSQFDTLSPVDGRRWDGLAAAMKARRGQLGYSIAQLSAVSGLSTSTLDNIEHNRKSSYDTTTISALERALRWQPGSVQRVLNGMDPQTTSDPDLDAILAAWPRLSPGARRMLRILATEGARAEG